mgnify:CR=1 FL=1
MIQPPAKNYNSDKIIKKQIKDGNQIFWVCPLIEESEESDLQAVTKRYEILSKIFKNKELCIN